MQLARESATSATTAAQRVGGQPSSIVDAHNGIGAANGQLRGHHLIHRNRRHTGITFDEYILDTLARTRVATVAKSMVNTEAGARTSCAARLDTQIVPSHRGVVRATQKGVRIVRHSGHIVDTLLVTVEDVLVGCLGPIEIRVDDHAIARAGDNLLVARPGQVLGREDVGNVARLELHLDLLREGIGHAQMDIVRTR